MADNPNLTDLDTNQDGWDTVVTDNFDAVENANNAAGSVSVTGSFQLTTAQIWDQGFIEFTDGGISGGANIDMPDTNPRRFGVRNNTSETLTFRNSASGGTTVAVAASEVADLQYDGTDLYRMGSSASASAYTDLTDTPANYSGDGGKAVRVKDDESGLEHVDKDSGTRYDFGMPKKSGQPEADEVLGAVVLAAAVTIPADFAGSHGVVDTDPDSDFTVSIRDDGVEIGTATILASGGTFNFATNGNNPQNVAAGSEMTFVAPGSGSTDASIDGLAMTILARIQ